MLLAQRTLLGLSEFFQYSREPISTNFFELLIHFHEYLRQKYYEFHDVYFLNILQCSNNRP